LWCAGGEREGAPGGKLWRGGEWRPSGKCAAFYPATTSLGEPAAPYRIAAREPSGTHCCHMRSMDKPDTRWEFVCLAPTESWTWRCFRTDGTTVTAPEPCESLMKIMVDAVRNGFSSGTQRWAIKDKEWHTDFAPGAEPKTTRTDPTTMPGGPKPGEQG